MEHHARVAIEEISQVGGARRYAQRMIEGLEIDATTAGNIAIVVSELATNLVRYAKAGELLMRPVGMRAFEIVSLDKGPGMEASRCLLDGYSTGGSSGTGLGAVQRLSNDFDIYSTNDHGSVVFSRLECQPRKHQPASFESTHLGSAPEIQWSAISIPVAGETECGDAWAIEMDDDVLRVVVSDGLGHGPEAARVSNQVVREFRNAKPSWMPKTFLEQIHASLSGTRGAAVAAGRIEHASHSFSYAGIGNIAASLVTADGSKGLMSHNGTIGSRIRTVQQIEYEWPGGGILIMHSDGLVSRWSFRDYPGLLTRHQALMAATLIRDFSRGRDDVTVAVIRRS